MESPRRSNMKESLLLLILFGLVTYSEALLPGNILGSQVEADAKRNVSELISSKGYPVENYDVQTEDGYILSVQHIPHGLTKSSRSSESKKVVLLVHALIFSANTWVFNNRTQSLAYILADAGYDVWLENARGNTYSRRHVSLTPEMKEFWDFSVDEMARYDLPAVIDFVLDKTGAMQLAFVGHSQGTTEGFALLSESPEYNEKISILIALAPITSIRNCRSLLCPFAPITPVLKVLYDLASDYEVLRNSDQSKSFKDFICTAKELCVDLILAISGFSRGQFNKTRLPVYTALEPSGSSTRNIVHFSQFVISDTFRKFDFGIAENRQRYGTVMPPAYALESITTPVALISAKDDLLGVPADVERLERRLKSVVFKKRIDSPAFGHGDFVWGIDAHRYVYQDVVRLLSQHAT